MNEPDASNERRYTLADLLEAKDGALAALRHLAVVKANPTMTIEQWDAIDAVERERLRRERETALAAGTAKELVDKRDEELVHEMAPEMQAWLKAASGEDDR